MGFIEYVSFITEYLKYINNFGHPKVLAHKTINLSGT